VEKLLLRCVPFFVFQLAGSGGRVGGRNVAGQPVTHAKGLAAPSIVITGARIRMSSGEEEAWEPRGNWQRLASFSVRSRT